MTHRVLGVRAERVVAHGSAPPGFLVHGGEPTFWTAYLNGGVVPRGETFRGVVEELAARAGVDVEPNPGEAARSYLENRGLPIPRPSKHSFRVLSAPYNAVAVMHR